MGVAQAQPVTPVFLGFPGAVKIKTPLNRELVATYEVTISVHDNASEVVDRSVSVPNGKRGLYPGSAGPEAGTAFPRYQHSFWVASTSLSILRAAFLAGAVLDQLPAGSGSPLSPPLASSLGIPGLYWGWRELCAHNCTMGETCFFLTIPMTSCQPAPGKYRPMCE